MRLLYKKIILLFVAFLFVNFLFTGRVLAQCLGSGYDKKITYSCDSTQVGNINGVPVYDYKCNPNSNDVGGACSSYGGLCGRAGWVNQSTCNDCNGTCPCKITNVGYNTAGGGSGCYWASQPAATATPPPGSTPAPTSPAGGSCGYFCTNQGSGCPGEVAPGTCSNGGICCKITVNPPDCGGACSCGKVTNSKMVYFKDPNDPINSSMTFLSWNAPGVDPAVANTPYLNLINNSSLTLTGLQDSPGGEQSEYVQTPINRLSYLSMDNGGPLKGSGLGCGGRMYNPLSYDRGNNSGSKGYTNPFSSPIDRMGRVVTKDGIGVPGVDLIVSNSYGNNSNSVTTDSEGYYKIPYQIFDFPYSANVDKGMQPSDKSCPGGPDNTGGVNKWFCYVWPTNTYSVTVADAGSDYEALPIILDTGATFNAGGGANGWVNQSTNTYQSGYIPAEFIPPGGLVGGCSFNGDAYTNFWMPYTSKGLSDNNTSGVATKYSDNIAYNSCGFVSTNRFGWHEIKQSFVTSGQTKYHSCWKWELYTRVNNTAPLTGNCNFIQMDTPPTFSLLNIRNLNGTTGPITSGTMLNGDLVNAENVAGVGTSENQLCQTDFSNQTSSGHSRDVSFRVNILDESGGDDLQKIGIKLVGVGTGNSMVYWMDNIGAGTTSPAALTWNIDATSTAAMKNNVSLVTYNNDNQPLINQIGGVGSTKVVAIFPLRFTKSFPAELYSLYVYASNKAGSKITGSVNNWYDTGRDFKVWNCEVPTSGTIYDASAVNQNLRLSCDPTAYQSVYAGASLTSLTFNSSIAAGSTLASLHSPSYPDYQALLTWGHTYTPTFNAAFEMAGSQMRSIDISVGVGNTRCVSGFSSLNLGDTGAVSHTWVVNPYASNPNLQLDMAGVMTQNPWYQAVNGGVVSNGPTQDGVPITCVAATTALCLPGVSINDIGASASSMVGGASIVNRSGCQANSCLNGYPAERNWSAESTTPFMRSFNYQGLFNQIYYQFQIGTTSTADLLSGLNPSPNHVYFIKPSSGTLVLDQDMSVDFNANEYNVFIVYGDLTVDQTVTRLDGIYMATGNISIGGSNATQLTINGSITGNQGITLNRSVAGTNIVTQLAADNTAAGVVVRYRPDFIFTVPQQLLRNLTNWSQGGL